jgi:anti-anti-sigma regulatory factor
MACRIDRLVIERGLVALRISGRITGDDVDVLRAAIAQEGGAVAIDLEEVGVVDRAAVNLLVFSEGRGIALRNCPPYIREWVDRERAQTPRTLLNQGHDQGVIDD